MARVELSLESLKNLDYGKVQAEFQKLLEFIIKDCWERPHDAKARKVLLQFEAEPVTDGHDCTDIRARFKMKASVPDRQTKDYMMGLTKGGHIYFQEDSSDSPDQESLPFEGKQTTESEESE